jgi:peptide/nickel transport system ATP-binding protein
MTELLSVLNIRVDFPLIEKTVHAVKEVSFEIHRGETLGLVGESGSGKSVTAKAIMAMLPSNAVFHPGATVRFAGEDLRKYTDEQMRAIRGDRISMIFQEPLTSLNPIYTVGSQIVEVIRAHRKISKKAARKEAIQLLKEVRIPDPEPRFNQYPHEMSGGQRQRVMIAIAIANNPDLLIADEPTTALDVTIQAQILRLIKDLQQKHGMAVLLITHDLTVVQKTCDRVCVMRHGEIVEQGETQQIFHHPKHPYTRHLIASEPSGHPEPLHQNSETVLTGDKVRVVFKIRHGSFFNRRTSDLVAVDDANLRLRKGETLGIVGESGSGKTTLGMGLIRLLNLTEGEVHWKNRRIDHLKRKELRPLRSKIQVVFQDPFSSLNPRMTVQQIVAEGLVVNDIESSDAKRKDRVREALEEVHMEADSMSRFPHEFSGGQRQRIAIARAIVMRPEFVLLDEPTSALDLSIQAQIIELLRELRRKHDLSYVFISHDLKVIKALCHNVLVMQHGKIVESGLTQHVLEQPQQGYTQELVQAAFQGIA